MLSATSCGVFEGKESARKLEEKRKAQKIRLQQLFPSYLWILLGRLDFILYIIFMLYFEGIKSQTTTFSSTGPLVFFP